MLMRTVREIEVVLLFVLLALSVGCSSASDQPSGSSGGHASGGTASTGGVGLAGGTSGDSGGVTATGGSPGPSTTGGASAGGGRAESSGGAGQAGRAGGGGSAGGAATGGTMAGGTKFVGNITTNGQVRPDFATFWNQITPENEGKWGSVEATRNQMNWAGLDRVHDYAKANGIAFKQHNFVWGSQQPTWLGNLSPAEQRAEVEEWIKLFCQRYPDVKMIDVVNEPPPHTTPVYMQALGGAGASGYDWIVQSFKWARQYCPNAILILNDYNNIEFATDNNHFIDIVNALKGANAPIDAVGAQAHDAYKLATAAVQGYVTKLATTGLPIYITEYDIDLADDAQQKTVMQNQFTLFWNDDNIKGVTLWGYVVGATWRPNTGLLTTAGVKRPALTWLMGFLGR